MRFALFIPLLVFCSSAWGLICGPGISKADRFTIKVKASAAASNVQWDNHLSFLYYFQILERDAEIEIPTWRLKFGHRDNRDEFAQSVEELSASPAGNLILRFYIRWAKRLAADVGDEERAGEFFLGLVNTKGLRYYGADGTMMLGADSVSEFAQKLSFDVVPGLSEMEMVLVSGQRVEQRLVGLFYVAMRRLKAVIRPGKLSPRELVDTGFRSQIHALGIAQTEMQTVSPERFALTFEPPGEGDHSAEFLFRKHDPKFGYFLLPSMGGDLANLVAERGALVSVDGQELVAFVPLSLNASENYLNDFIFFERLFYPWLRDLKALQLMSDVASALNGTPLPVPSGGAPREMEDDLEKKPNLLRERAIAHALSATWELGQRNVERDLSDMMVRMLMMDPQAVTTFVMFEQVARKYHLPVQVTAQNKFSFPLRFVWPPVARYKSRTYAPTHALVVYGHKDSETSRLLQALGLTPERNLELLDNYAGLGVNVP